MEEEKCKCGKKVDLNNTSKTLETFEYIGADETNNPIFKCKTCGEYVSG